MRNTQKTYTEQNFPFHRNNTDAKTDAKTLFENICTAKCVEVKANEKITEMVLCKDAYKLGDQLIYFYTEHALIQSRIRGKKSPLEQWLCRNHQKNNKNLPFPAKNEMAKVRDEIWRNGEPSVFSAFLSKAVFDWFKPETVFDPCAGWGARAIGALAAKSVKCYVATDINEKLFETDPPGFGYANLKTELDGTDKLAFFNCSILDFDSSKRPTVTRAKIPAMYDMIFTSPPFYDYEIYNNKHAFKNGKYVQHKTEKDEEFKDTNAVYSTYEEWQKKFYLPFCEKLHTLIKPGGIVVLHVGSTWISPKLPEVTRAMMEYAGFIYDYEFHFSSSKKVPVLVFRTKK